MWDFYIKTSQNENKRITQCVRLSQGAVIHNFFLKWRDWVSRHRDGVTECNHFDLYTHYCFICFEIRAFYYYFIEHQWWNASKLLNLMLWLCQLRWVDGFIDSRLTLFPIISMSLCTKHFSFSFFSPFMLWFLFSCSFLMEMTLLVSLQQPWMSLCLLVLWTLYSFPCVITKRQWLPKVGS